jgi:oligopeptide/dipeptide ABC transporter ATP-binding protein
MIFQDPYSSLNPRMSAGEAVEEALTIHKLCATKTERREKALSIFEKTGLRKDQYSAYPHELSGGQRQRIGIARALVLGPRLLVCDEPVSALDVSIQSQLLNLFTEMKETNRMSYLFISHNMSIVRYISDRVGVMYLGRLMEIARTEELFDRPRHPYTEALLSAIPRIGGARTARPLLEGDIPSPLAPPPGCVFHTRCPVAKKHCAAEIPPLIETGEGHLSACFR